MSERTRGIINGEMASVSFGKPDPDDSDEWIDDGITYATVALEGEPRLGAGKVALIYRDDLAQVRREAAVKALREAADDMDARANKNELIARADRWEGYYSGVRSSILNETSALRARADRMEAGEQ